MITIIAMISIVLNMVLPRFKLFSKQVTEGMIGYIRLMIIKYANIVQIQKVMVNKLGCVKLSNA